MHQSSDADPDLIADTAAYLTRLRDETEAAVGPLRPGAGRQVLAQIIDDPSLNAYVRRWARHQEAIESKVGPLDRLPADDVYRRLRAALLRHGVDE